MSTRRKFPRRKPNRDEQRAIIDERLARARLAAEQRVAFWRDVVAQAERNAKR